MNKVPRRLQLAIWNLVNLSEEWENPYGATLTFRKVHRGLEGLVPITREDCEQNLRHFLNLLNRKISRRRTMKAIWALEKDASGRFHYHVALDVPLTVPHRRFEYWVKTLWPETHCGYEVVHVQEGVDQGWLHYLAKGAKPDDLNVDWNFESKR